MGRKVAVSVLKVPYIISNDEPYGHVRPEHILLTLGGVDSPPTGHTEDVDNTCDGVNDVPPTAVEPYVLRREPPATCKSAGSESLNSRLDVGCNSDKDVDTNDNERPRLEPFLCADTPLILKHDETYTADICCIELSIMEPTIHVDVCVIVNCPINASASCNCDNDEINSKCERQNNENCDSAEFGATSDFVHDNQTSKDQYPSE